MGWIRECLGKDTASDRVLGEGLSKVVISELTPEWWERALAWEELEDRIVFQIQKEWQCTSLGVEKSLVYPKIRPNVWSLVNKGWGVVVRDEIRKVDRPDRIGLVCGTGYETEHWHQRVSKQSTDVTFLKLMLVILWVRIKKLFLINFFK